MDNEAFHAENNSQPAPASGEETQSVSSPGAGNTGTNTVANTVASEDRAMEDAYAKAMSKRGIRTEPEHKAQDGGSEGQGTSAQPGGGSGPSPTNSEPSAERGVKQGEPGGKGNTGSRDDAERRAWNRQQAAMRIARKQERQRLYQEELDRLNREKEAFEQEGENQNPTMVQVKDDQIKELNIQMVRELQQEWQREAYEMFTPEDAQQFLADSQKYADWINKNEPELSKYINRPYGRYLLKGWFDKVAKNPELADRWEAMNPYQKYQMLEKHYRELEKFGEDYAAGRVQIGVQNQQPNQQQTQTGDGQQQSQQTQQSQAPQPKDIPVPGSGRNTDTEPPGDNIDLLIDRAMQKRKAALHR